ncbi:MAG: universal stress protein [Candidatus Dormibacteraeota bacterium]|nr:universal stress protein [Candidatus Dormibacteraeota bacterium]
MIKTIVVGTDGSAHGQHAVEFAAALAKQLDAEVALVHVTNQFPAPLAMAGGYIPYMPQAAIDEVAAAIEKEVKDEFAEPLRTAGVSYTVRVIEGSAAGKIQDCAVEADAQLIVVGTRGMNSLGEFFLGSTSHALLHQAQLPVIVVPLSAATHSRLRTVEKVPIAV